jgi:CRISPR/Cas system endoribonuclease Cas6 (RAMP superfamily)
MVIVLEYISDGLAYELDTKVPKLAEEAMYAHILHAIISTRSNQPEYLVNRLKQERRAKLRNTKIRLSNIKLEEITQVLRGQSKWIKH